MLFAVRMTVSIICVTTLAMYLVCVGTDYWQSTRYRNSLQFRSAIEGTHHGLWNGCYVQNKHELCGHIHNDTHWLRAVRAFMVLGLIANFVAMIVAFMGLLKEDICFRIVAYTLLVNAVLVMIGLSVYTGRSGIPFERAHQEGSFGWSFVVCWCTWLLTIVGCVFAFLDDCNGLDRVLQE